MYIGIYVDDIILAGKTIKQLEEIKSDLSWEFDIKDLGKLGYFLGMKVVQNKKVNQYGLDSLLMLKTF